MSVAPGNFGPEVLTSNIDFSSGFNTGSGGFNFGNILQGGIQSGLNSLLGGLFDGVGS